MSGPERVEYKLVGITFPRYEISPLYIAEQPVAEKDIQWIVVWDFKGKRKNAQWDELKVTVTINMKHKAGNFTIAFLATESLYYATPGLPYNLKYIIALRVINEAIGHAQGGWNVKNLNVSIASKLPQAYNKVEEEKAILQKKIYEYWE